MPDSDAEESARQLIKILTELETLLRQAVVFDFAGAPITIAKLRSFVREAEEACTKAQSHITRIQELQDEQRALKQDLKRLDKTSTAALTISRFLDVGILNKIAEVERLERVRQAGQRDLCGYDDKFRMHLQSATDITAAAFRSTARSELDSARDSLKTAESSYSKFAEQHDKSTKLLQQLRDVANELLLDASSSDVCPLCHTEFPPGELIKHIRHDVDRALEEKAASLLKEVRTCKERVDASRIMEQIAEWLKQFCQQHGHSDSTALDTIRSEIASTQEALTDADRGLAQIRSELMKLAESGITPELYERFLPQVASALGSKDLVSAKSVTQLRAHLGSEKEEVTSKLNELDETIRDSEQSLEELLTEPPEGTTHGSLVAATRERITMVNGVLERLQSTLHSFPWPTDKPLSDLVVAVKSARNVALQFQSALTEERTETKQLAEASGRKEQIEKQLAGLEPRIERLREAQGVLLRIRNEHSLNSAMENALRQNRIAIETIFGRIHSPAEFSGLGDSLTTLIREAGGTLANLHQISTGQRAAFALSLFLAQNSQLRTAPPIMLIDDPIAHVDDLNCLSFLDFLRELVVMGDRQIVFSTANDKLATLFARKFEFLGDEEFRRFSLTR